MNKKQIAKTSDLEDAVKNELNSGKENLEKNRKTRAAKSQKETGKKLLLYLDHGHCSLMSLDMNF